MADYLSTYLNDHLAGSTGGEDLAKRLAEQNEGSTIGDTLARLHTEIAEDRDILVKIMDNAGVSENPVKQAGAWIGEKASRLKPNEHLTEYSPLSRMMELEMMSIGVEGKRKLWIALEIAQKADDRLAGEDFAALAERARAQADELEKLRRGAAEEAFAGAHSGSAN
jgi:hypothetical protein